MKKERKIGKWYIKSDGTFGKALITPEDWYPIDVLVKVLRQLELNAGLLNKEDLGRYVTHLYRNKRNIRGRRPKWVNK